MHVPEGMQTQGQRRYRIVIALDRSEYSEIVLEHALDQAARHDSPDLHALAVVEEPEAVEETKLWLARTLLEGLDAFRAGRTDWRTRLHIRCGTPEEEIPNLAAEVDADLLVIGRYGVHHPRRSTADAVITAAPCPVLVVGLAGHTVDAEQVCAACAAVREDSDGERWFCEAHAAPGRMRLSTLLSTSAPLTRGGTLW